MNYLTPLIANGTTAFEWGYQPWIPFYNFIPIILALSLFLGFWKGAFYGISLIVSSLMSLILTYGLWTMLNLTPNAVLVVWILSTAFTFWSSELLRLQRLQWLINGIEPGEDHSHTMHDFDNYSDYRAHIKTAHPDIYQKYFSDESEEEKENADSR